MSPKFSLAMTPHLREPLEAIADNSNEEVCLLFPVGAGKTTLFEALTCYIVSEDPGPMLITGQTDDTSKNWFESRLTPVLEACDPIKPLWPKNRYAKRKTEVLFPHMPLFGGGANLTNLQEKSMRWVFGDEIWRWAEGMMEEARRRTHDRWNGRCLFVSQGGSEDTEWHRAWKDCEQFAFHWNCPGCGGWFRWLWKHFTYEVARDENGDFDWPEIYKSVVMTCPECEQTFNNDPVTRRQLADGSEYRSLGGAFVPGHVGYQVSAMGIWKIDWGKLAREWIQASEAAKQGIDDARRQFIQKRLAEFWEERADVPEVAGGGDSYSLKEYAEGERWEKEDYRFMFVDVQKGWFFANIRAWSMSGESRLLWRGKLSTWEHIPELQARFGIANRFVGVDCGYQPDTVAEKRALLERASGVESGKVTRADDRWWKMFKGEDSEGYPIYKKRGNRTIKVIRGFSNYVTNQTQSRIRYRFVKVSNLRMKDQLASLMGGEGPEWGLAGDVGKQYHKELQGEKRVKKGNRWIWLPVKDHTRVEAWDVEVGQVVMATLHGCISGEVIETEGES